MTVQEERNSEELLSSTPGAAGSGSSDDFGAEQGATVVAATAVAEGPAGEELCCHCQAPRKPGAASWCLQCGYYPLLGRCIELEEKVTEDGSIVEVAEEASEFSIRDVPVWVWALLVGVAVLLVMSITARLVTPAESSLRTAWSLSQLFMGLLVFAIAHIGCYLYAIMDNDELQILDLLMRPLSVWAPSVNDMPKSFRRVAAGTWGMSASLFAMLIIGGIPYSALWDFGGEKARVKNNLVQAIANQAAGKTSDADTMEQAAKDFAQAAGIDKMQKMYEKQGRECLIIGFVPRGEDDFYSLILASVDKGKLRYVGTVSDGISEEVRAELNHKLRENLRDEPFVDCSLKGSIWIEPKLVCNVHFKSLSKDRELQDVVFDQMRADLEVKK